MLKKPHFKDRCLSLTMFGKVVFFILLASPFLGIAQQTVSGKVYDLSDKKIALASVLVRNLATKKSTLTEATGDFSIVAKAGDLLEFSFVGYHTDTLYLINLSKRIVYLPPNSTNLKEVKILGGKINAGVLLPDPGARVFKRVENDALNGKGNNDRVGGLKFNLGYGKYKKREEAIKALEQRDFYEAEISRVFTPVYVTALTKLKGQELKDFMNIYRPSALLVERDRPFNYDYYTVSSYRTWLKLPASQRKLQLMPILKSD